MRGFQSCLILQSSTITKHPYTRDQEEKAGFTREGFAFTARYSADNRLTYITYTDGSGINHHTEYMYTKNFCKHSSFKQFSSSPAINPQKTGLLSKRHGAWFCLKMMFSMLPTHLLATDWQETLENHFEIVETFDQLQNWRGQNDLYGYDETKANMPKKHDAHTQYGICTMIGHMQIKL